MGAGESKMSKHLAPQEQHQKEVRILLLGKTGLGKSSLGNSICGSQEKDTPFRTNSSSSSITEASQCAYRDYNGRKLCIIDTPGLSDTNRSNETVIRELKKGFHLACPGPHAFLIVINGRCTDEQTGVLELLRKLFGNGVVKHCILVITRANALLDDDDDQSSDADLINRYFNEAPASLFKFKADVQERCILIENRAPLEIREQRLLNLLT